MDNSINSISTLLPQLIRLYNNAIESFEKLTEAVTTTKDNLKLNIISNDDSLKQIAVPSIGYIKNRLSIMEQNWESLAGSESTSSIRMPDGSFRRLITTEIQGEPNQITDLSSINEFKSKSNYFLEKLMDPMMYVSIDITEKVPIDIENVQMSKFILDISTTADLEWFDTTYKNKSNISYTSFLRDIIYKKIPYVLDDRTLDVPPRTLRYYGKFNVIRINDTVVTETTGSTTISKVRKKYKLNKLTYSDNRSSFEDTLSLKINDILVVESSPRDTKYKVVEIDTSTNSIVLELVEGFRGIKIGTDVISFFSDKDNSVEIDIPIGFNERSIFFIKPVDPHSKLPARQWSPGIGIYSNDLNIKTITGEIQSLATYYRTEVIDFSNYIISLAKERIPPASLGITPNAPALNQNDFKITKINDHITDTATIDQIVKLQNEKISLESELRELDKSIKQKREKIATESRTDTYTIQTDENELKTYIDQRNTRSQLYADIVKDMEAIFNAKNLSSATPKYRIRGFFPFPELKFSNETGYQNIVQFVVYYRYLSTDGSSSSVKQFQYTDGSNIKNGSYTNWNIIKTNPRERIYNSTLQQYEWKENNVENSDEYNINSVDIPIQKGESVEIKIKSVSEAGWPSNPLMSDFSNSIIIDFPESLSTDNTTDKIIEANKADLLKIKLQEELRVLGIYSHVETSFINQNKYYPHNATDIASGFLSPEQAPITLFDKLVDLSTRLQSLEEILKKAKGTLVAKITDEDGNQIIMKRNQMNRLFAGYYYDSVKNLEIKKGVIVTKTYTLTFENTAATTLELISRVAGTYTKRVKASEPASITYSTGILPAAYSYYDNNDTSIDGNPTYSTNDKDYNELRRYDLAPIVLSNPTKVDNHIAVAFPYQASQVKAQFVYVRYKDIASEETFYSYDKPNYDGTKSTAVAPNNKINLVDDAENYYGRSNISTVTTQDKFIWGGCFTNAGIPLRASAYDGSNDYTIELHINHPQIASYAAFAASYKNVTGITIPALSTGNYNATLYARHLYRHSKFAPLTALSDLGKKQCIYLYDESVSNQAYLESVLGTGKYSNIPIDRTVKTSFDENDQYLLGRNSCGSYLFLATDTHETICVDGKNSISKVNVEYGSPHSIKVPLIFQYRMTDFWGAGTDGIGNIAGDSSGATTNVTYSKRIGIDLYDINEQMYSYDIEVTAKYKTDNLKLEQLPVRSLQVAIDDVTKTIASMSPTITEAKVTSTKQNSSFS